MDYGGRGTDQLPPQTQVQGGGGFAITSLVCGIVGATFGWVPILSVLALVLSIVGFAIIQNSVNELDAEFDKL